MRIRRAEEDPILESSLRQQSLPQKLLRRQLSARWHACSSEVACRGVTRESFPSDRDRRTPQSRRSVRPLGAPSSLFYSPPHHPWQTLLGWFRTCPVQFRMDFWRLPPRPSSCPPCVPYLTRRSGTQSSGFSHRD